MVKCKGFDRLKKIGLITFCLSSCCYALEEAPWYGNVYEFKFIGGYEYNFFKHVSNATRALKSTFNTQVFSAGLDFTAPETWNWETELEFADTTPISFGYRSFALQVRKLWLDDVACDPISLSTGLVYRDASGRMRKALSTPYHARANFEFHTSIGKEWNRGCYWNFRTFATAAIGQGSQGSPWLRGDLFLWWNLQDCHQFSIFGLSYFGLGDKRKVPTKHFDGWSKIGHQSIELGLSYRYFFRCYGNLRFDYMYRVYARSYPEKVNCFRLTYELPFSCF